MPALVDRPSSIGEAGQGANQDVVVVAAVVVVVGGSVVVVGGSVVVVAAVVVVVDEVVVVAAVVLVVGLDVEVDEVDDVDDDVDDVDDGVEVEVLEEVLEEVVEVDVVEVRGRVVVVKGNAVEVVVAAAVVVVRNGADVVVPSASSMVVVVGGCSPSPMASRIDCTARRASTEDRSGAGNSAPDREAVAVKARTIPRATTVLPVRLTGASQGRSASPAQRKLPPAQRSLATLICIRARTTEGSKAAPDISPIWRRAAA
jgi:hypothetical protein